MGGWRVRRTKCWGEGGGGDLCGAPGGEGIADRTIRTNAVCSVRRKEGQRALQRQESKSSRVECPRGLFVDSSAFIFAELADN